MKSFRHLVRITFLLILSASLPSFAYQVQPMVSELQTTGSNSSITYRVINPADTSIPIEVEVMRRSFDENMQEVLTPDDSDFIVLPPQIDVPANGYQVFRAQYIGDGDFDTTQSYRIVFKQLPLQNQEQQSQVNMIFNFATLVFVSPPEAQGQLQQTLDCQEKSACMLTVTNVGDGVMPLIQSILQVNGEQLADWAWLQQAIGMTYLMPKHVLKIDISELVADLSQITSVEMVTANNAN